MSDLKLVVVDYKRPELYFKGFYSDAQVGSYGFQLQRMFDFNNAIQGEYMVLYLEDKPFMQIHVDRSNSFRILTKPNFARDTDQETIDKYLIEGYGLVLDQLKEFYEYSPSRLKFEIEIDSNEPKYSDLLSFLETRGFSLTDRFYNYSFGLDDYSAENQEFEATPFGELEIQQRFDLLSEYIPRSTHIDKERFYQDYLELDSLTERLWKLYKVDGETIGFVLYGVDSGFMKTSSIHEIRAFNENNKDILSDIALNELKFIATEHKSQRLKIKASEGYFSKLFPIFEESLLS